MKEDNGDRQEAIGGDGNGKRSARGDRMAMVRRRWMNNL
jgi:hypothetical protein